MINDICDYCLREFGREPGKRAICMSCGLENVRPEPATMPVPDRATKQVPKPVRRPREKR